MNKKEYINAVLDEIRTEIRKKMRFNSFNEGIVSYDDINKIFNKYKAEKSNQDTVPFDIDLFEAGLMCLPKDIIEVLDKIKAEIKEWYWQVDKQTLAKDPCVVDAMIDLFIRTIDKYTTES